MKHIIVAPFGNQIEDLFVAIREFPTERVILMTPEKYQNDVQKVVDDLKRFKIPADVMKIKGDSWEGMFKAISQVKERVGREILVHVSTGDRLTQCAATSAAFVNGVKAFSVIGDSVMMLPVLKFNYYKLLTDKKLSILNVLGHQQDCCGSLEELSKRTKMSLPLISYHINGSQRSEGLKTMGLVETEEKNGRIAIKLSVLGRLLMEGYIEQPILEHK
ncbi:MAG: hypothetical protein KKA90_04230 [Nanoarchaeota archaeon]|nr:hypothetical protein [Nanoarchaeota archaeon]